MNAVTAHFTAAETPLLSMETIDELAENMGGSAADDTEEDTSNPLDDTEGFNSRLEMFADQLVKSCGDRGKPSQGIPEIIFCIECIHPNHPVNNTLDKGYFSIRGSALERLSVAQAVKWADENLSKSCCGTLGCTITLGDCLQERIEGEILCYLCKGNVLVDAHVACSDHPETKLEYLVVAAPTRPG